MMEKLYLVRKKQHDKDEFKHWVKTYYIIILQKLMKTP